MSTTPKSHQCHHKPVKKEKQKKKEGKKKKKDFFKRFNTFSDFFLSSPKTSYELLNIASEESTLGRQKCTLSRELGTHSQTVVQM